MTAALIGRGFFSSFRLAITFFPPVHLEGWTCYVHNKGCPPPPCTNQEPNRSAYAVRGMRSPSRKQTKLAWGRGGQHSPAIALGEGVARGLGSVVVDPDVNGRVLERQADEVLHLGGGGSRQAGARRRMGGKERLRGRISAGRHAQGDQRWSADPSKRNPFWIVILRISHPSQLKKKLKLKLNNNNQTIKRRKKQKQTECQAYHLHAGAPVVPPTSCP